MAHTTHFYGVNQVKFYIFTFVSTLLDWHLMTAAIDGYTSLTLASC